MEKARELKQQAIEILKDATFTLHKWQSNEPKLEENPVPPVDKEGTFAKQQLVKPHAGGSSLLGLGWDKERDEIIISFPEWVTQRLVAAKARLAKRGLTIPRLELISAHMVTNLLMNVKFAMEGLPVTELNGWLDSTVALFWINGGGQYKQLMENWVQKFRAQSEIIWRHVPTKENPADLASRGGDVEYREMWWEGPEWMADRERWPPEQINQPSAGSTAEAKATKELFALAVDVTDRLDAVLEKFELNKAINNCAWISRFLYNSRYPNQKLSGPLTTKEIKNQQTFWVKRSQQNCDFQDDRLQLNLQPNQDGILECRGRIQGAYPIYLPDKHLYTQKLVHHEHLHTLHGGVGLTMTSVRRHHWGYHA